jgi:HAD superfamily hydrolase (TIGR01509 family)
VTRFGAVFFDFDGVLVIFDWWSIIEQVLRRHGLEIVRREDGLRLEDAIALQIPESAPGHEELRASVVDEVREESLPLIERTPLTDRDGILEVIRQLRGRGIKVGVVSSSTSEQLRRVLQKNGLLEGLAVLVGGDDEEVARGKPAPDCYEVAARRAQIRRSRCCAVEDSPNGIRAAKAAGMYVIQFAGEAERVVKHERADSLAHRFPDVSRIVLEQG